MTLITLQQHIPAAETLAVHLGLEPHGFILVQKAGKTDQTLKQILMLETVWWT